MDRSQPNYQKRYRKKQSAKGLTRFEIQIPAETKAKFDELVESVAEEYVSPYGKRQRVALARIQVFEEITQDITHDFFELRDKIELLREEIKALSPKFFKGKVDKAHIPEAIQSLPDDSKKLKQILSKLYKEAQASRLAATEAKRRANQFEELYNAASDYNEMLKKKFGIEEPI